MSKYRAFTFTLNNYTEDDYNYLYNMDTRYIIIGRESAPTTGTPHLQGYLYFKNQRTLSSLKKEFPTCHWEIAHADTEYNRKYCKKGNHSPMKDDGSGEQIETEYYFKGFYYMGDGLYEEKGNAPSPGHLKGMLIRYLDITTIMLNEGITPRAKKLDQELVLMLYDLMIHFGYDEDQLVTDGQYDEEKLGIIYRNHYNMIGSTIMEEDE